MKTWIIATATASVLLAGAGAASAHALYQPTGYGGPHGAYFGNDYYGSSNHRYFGAPYGYRYEDPYRSDNVRSEDDWTRSPWNDAY